MDLNFLDYLQHFSYLGIVIVLILGSFGLSLPEEIIFLSIGYFSYLGIFDIKIAILLSWLGVILGDNLIYFLAHQGSNWILNSQRYLINQLTPFKNFFQKYGTKAVFLARFVPVFRFLSPVFAGLSKMKWWQFFLYDSAGALIWIPVVTLIGFHFHSYLDLIIGELKLVKHAIFIIMVLLIGGSYYLYKKSFNFSRK